MDQAEDRAMNMAAGEYDKVSTVLDKLVDVAQPQSAFRDPVTAGEFTVINASEVTASVGTGFGLGSYRTDGGAERPRLGGGGGGAGVSVSRPVASIVVGPQGVSVQPLFDYTKIIIAAITAAGGMLMVVGRIIRAAKR